MKVKRVYRRPWHGPNEGKLVVLVDTPQHGMMHVAICRDELVSMSQLFNGHLEHTEGRHRGNYRELRRELARAIADYIADYMPDKMEGPRP